MYKQLTMKKSVKLVLTCKITKYEKISFQIVCVTKINNHVMSNRFEHISAYFFRYDVLKTFP
jgi:hypothetical protein